MKEVVTILVCLLLAIPAIAQEHYFLDETDRRLPQETSISMSADAADIDGDGDLDIIGDAYAAIPPYQPYYLFINDGRGFFSQENEERLPDTSFLSVDMGFGDIDGDNDYDAYIGSEHYQDMLFINDGSGYFFDETSERLPPVPCVNSGFVLADFSGDGCLDIITICSRTHGLNHYLLNSGLGYFEDETDMRMPVDTLWDMTGKAVDVDNDLDLDLLLSWMEQSSILHIRGLENVDGYFLPFAEQRMDDRFARWIDAADIDADGDLDVIISGIIDLGILINYGGRLVDETDDRIENLGPEHGNPSMIGLGDYDNDGDIDIYAGFAIVTMDHLFLNDGQGYFTRADERMPETEASTNWAEPFDADGDGDLDLFLACSGDGVQRILINYSSPDTIPPNFLALEAPEGIVDTASQFGVLVSAYDNISVEKGALAVELSYRVNGGSFNEVDFAYCGGTIFSSTIPGQPEGSFVEYYVTLRDKMGNVNTSPPGAPDSLYSFWVSFQTDIENENETPIMDGLSVSPNPSNDEFIVRYFSNSNEYLEMAVYDMMGRKLHSEDLRETNRSGWEIWNWDGWRDLPSGVYFIQLTSSIRKEVTKAVLIR